MPALDDSDSANDNIVPPIPGTYILDVGGNAGVPRNSDIIIICICSNTSE